MNALNLRLICGWDLFGILSLKWFFYHKVKNFQVLKLEHFVYLFVDEYFFKDVIEVRTIAHQAKRCSILCSRDRGDFVTKIYNLMYASTVYSRNSIMIVKEFLLFSKSNDWIMSVRHNRGCIVQIFGRISRASLYQPTELARLLLDLWMIWLLKRLICDRYFFVNSVWISKFLILCNLWDVSSFAVTNKRDLTCNK